MPLKEPEISPLSESVKRVIGKGIAFPFSFSSQGRASQVSVAYGIEKINESIHMILSTRRGERIYMPEYGSGLYMLVFEPEDEILYDRLYFETVDAVSTWEKRINVTNVTILGSEYVQNNISPDANYVGIYIEYIILANHAQGSYVYPFQLGGLPLSASY